MGEDPQDDVRASGQPRETVWRISEPRKPLLYAVWGGIPLFACGKQELHQRASSSRLPEPSARKRFSAPAQQQMEYVRQYGRHLTVYGVASWRLQAAHMNAKGNFRYHGEGASMHGSAGG